MNVCGKSLIKEIKSQKLTLMNPIESQNIKRKLVWTGIMDYDSTKPMPQWIIDRFPYNEQE
jgi:hypothetical protein